MLGILDILCPNNKEGYRSAMFQPNKVDFFRVARRERTAIIEPIQERLPLINGSSRTTEEQLIRQKALKPCSGLLITLLFPHSHLLIDVLKQVMVNI